MHGGFGYHSIYKNIPEFVRQADVNDIRQKVFAP